MAGLMLSLKADEKFLVNGALVQNGPKRAQIRLPDNTVNVLRLSDCLHPDEINTPVRRAYYLAQLILSGDIQRDKGKLKLTSALYDLDKVFAGTSVEPLITKTLLATTQERYYSVLVMLKRVLPVEEQLLGQGNHTFGNISDIPSNDKKVAHAG